MVHARCRGLIVDLFYPEQGDNGTVAKAICVLCPVRQPCLEYAVKSKEEFGVWGGKCFGFGKSA
jgi:WhiB family redox-sensing transcriptional regulator